MSSTFIQASDVAALIGYTSGAAFLLHRATLESDLGFPRPMPTSQRPLRWRRDAVEAWAQMQGQLAAVGQTRPAGPNVRLIELARSA